MKQWQAFMTKYYPAGSLIDALNVYGYTVAATLTRCSGSAATT